MPGPHSTPNPRPTPRRGAPAGASPRRQAPGGAPHRCGALRRGGGAAPRHEQAMKAGGQHHSVRQLVIGAWCEKAPERGAAHAMLLHGPCAARHRAAKAALVEHVVLREPIVAAHAAAFANTDLCSNVLDKAVLITGQEAAN